MSWVVTVRCKCGAKLGDVIDTDDGRVFVHARPIRKTIVEDGRGFTRWIRPPYRYPERREPLADVWQVQCPTHDWLYVERGHLLGDLDEKVIIDHHVAAGLHRDAILKWMEAEDKAYWESVRDASAVAAEKEAEEAAEAWWDATHEAADDELEEHD